MFKTRLSVNSFLRRRRQILTEAFLLVRQREIYCLQFELKKSVVVASIVPREGVCC